MDPGFRQDDEFEEGIDSYPTVILGLIQNPSRILQGSCIYLTANGRMDPGFRQDDGVIDV